MSNELKKTAECLNCEWRVKLKNIDKCFNCKYSDKLCFKSGFAECLHLKFFNKNDSGQVEIFTGCDLFERSGKKGVLK